MPNHHSFFSEHRQYWMRFGSILICMAAIVLLVFTSSTDISGISRSPFLLVFVLFALCVAISMHARFVFVMRSEHKETISVLDATEHEYRSVFENALDSILILDNRAVCLAANKAAPLLFGTSREGLAGKPIRRFFESSEAFNQRWGRFLEDGTEHCEVRLTRPDGAVVFVEFTAKAYYAPGRHLAVLRDVTSRKLAEEALRESEERFRQMAANIQEIFWMLDAESMKVLFVSPAYEAITGRSCESLEKDPKSYEEVIHPEDRVRALSRLRESRQNGGFDEEFRIVTVNGQIRWLWVRGFPVRDSRGSVCRLVGTAQDISARKSTEEQLARNLDAAEAARTEAEAFRQTSFALTQNLSMDYVLETLLQSLMKLISCESAQVLLLEDGTRFFLAREVQNAQASRCIPKFPATFDAKDNAPLMRILSTKSSVLLPDTHETADWGKVRYFSHFHSWLCVPLLTSEQFLGVLSVCDGRTKSFTQEHLRVAKSLAIPAAVAIQNARLYQRAEIFRAELERRVTELERAQSVLRQVQTARESS